MPILRPLLFALALVGCAAPPSGAPAPDAAPCPPEVRSPSAGAWRRVRAEGFAFCVPRGWRPSGEPAAAGVDAPTWSGPGGWITWGTGPYRAPDRAPVVVNRREGDRSPPGELRRFPESIGGASADLWDDRAGRRHFTGAEWARPRRVHLYGEAEGAAAAAVQLDVYRTVRFTR
ncbi:MAG TPA: hypothetical protein VF263_03275 [Longimicrobiaceae bacterium]